MVARFLTRPKADFPCMWIRMHYWDKFIVEGIVTTDLMEFDPDRIEVLLPAQDYGDGEGRGRHHVPFCIPRWMLTRVDVLGTLNTRRAASAALKEEKWKKTSA